jgi:hypothetical protein
VIALGVASVQLAHPRPILPCLQTTCQPTFCCVPWPWLKFIAATGIERRATPDYARGRAAAGAAALRPFASARLRASVLRQSSAPTLLARADRRSKVQFVEAQRGVRREHEVMTTMDKARCLEGGERVDHF